MDNCPLLEDLHRLREQIEAEPDDELRELWMAMIVAVATSTEEELERMFNL